MIPDGEVSDLGPTGLRVMRWPRIWPIGTNRAARVSLHVGAGFLVALSLVLVAGRPATGQPVPVELPVPTGEFAIGTREVHLIDERRLDPFVAGRRKRELIVQLWYPAVPRGPLAPYVRPLVRPFIEAAARLRAGSLVGIRSHAHTAAPTARIPGKLSVLLLSPAGRQSRSLYTALCEELASHGFVVATLDHTHEAPAVLFPGGRIARRTVPLDVPHPSTLSSRIAAERDRDVDFLLRQLPAISRAFFRGMLNVRRVGIFGHSLGGRTAAKTAAVSPTIAAGADLDGGIFDLSETIRRPFMAITAGSGAYLEMFWQQLQGFRLWVRLVGAGHLTFGDWVALRPQMRPPGRAAGTIDAARALEIQSAYLRAFFGTYLRGSPDPLLRSASPYPEVGLRR